MLIIMEDTGYISGIYHFQYGVRIIQRAVSDKFKGCWFLESRTICNIDPPDYFCPPLEKGNTGILRKWKLLIRKAIYIYLRA